MAISSCITYVCVDQSKSMPKHSIHTGQMLKQPNDVDQNLMIRIHNHLTYAISALALSTSLIVLHHLPYISDDVYVQKKSIFFYSSRLK